MIFMSLRGVCRFTSHCTTDMEAELGCIVSETTWLQKRQCTSTLDVLSRDPVSDPPRPPVPNY